MTTDATGPPPRVVGAAPADAAPGELALGPATRLLWRTPDTVHLEFCELGEDAVVVEGLSQPLVAAIARRGPRAPGSTPLGDHGVERALASLIDSGHLWTRGEDPDDPRLAPPVARLSGELTALAARHGEQAADLLAARSYCSVVVHGGGRAGPHVAALLAASGVRRVHCVAGGSARLDQAAPGGLLPTDEGGTLAAAAQQAILRAAPETITGPLPAGHRPDLTIMVADSPVDEDHRAALHAAGAAHLVVRLGPARGVIGPLVVPGLTSCLRCADLHRRDRDPAWAALAAQLTLPHRYARGSAVAVATVVAGVAAAQALAFLDGEDPACIEGTLEARPPDWRLRRRSWPTHPECDCVEALPPDAPGDQLSAGRAQ